MELFEPDRNATPYEKKLKLKLWITPGLLKSIQTKYRMFKRLNKYKNNLALTDKYKAYRNALNRLLRLANLKYYHCELNELKGNPEKYNK